MQSLWMLAAAFLFSLMAVCTKLGAEHFSTFELVFYRSLFGMIVIALWVLLKRQTLRTKFFFSHMKRSFFGTLGLTIWFWTLGVLPLGTSMTLNYTSPLYMALFVSVIALRAGRRPSLWLLAAIAAGFIGVVLALRPEVHAGEELAATIGLSSGFFSALAYMQVKGLTKIGEPDWRIVFYFTLFGTVCGLLGQLVTAGGLNPIRAEDLPALLGIGVTATLAQLCLTRAWGAGNMLLTSALQFSAIVFAAVLGLIFFAEPIAPATAIGIAIIIVAGVSATVLTKRTPQK